MRMCRFMNKEMIMKWNRIIGCLAIGAMFWACSDSDDKDVVGGASGDSGITAVTDWEVAGVSQKGPFVTGSAVTVQELDGITLKQTGKSFKGSIKSDKGDFAIKDINLESQYAILEATGYYRDEVSGKKSSGTVTLRALTDLSNRKTVNINLLTHLEYERVMYLVNKKKMSIADAKAQAEEEVLASFGIEGDFGESEDLNIFKSGDGNAALLAVSVLLQGDVDVAGLTERMGEFSISLAEGGSWDDADTKTAIADWACDVDLKGSLSKVRKNVEGWKYADTVPAFEKYVTNFWWDNYGLGVCNKKRENETKRNVNKLSKLYNEYFVCEKGRWHIPGDEPVSSSGKGGSSSSKPAESSSSSKDVEPAEGSSSSKDVEPAETSSSSVYNPFNPVNPDELDTLPPLPEEVPILDSVVKKVSYKSFGDGKQEVWFLTAGPFFSSSRDSIGKLQVDKLAECGFSFDGVVKNDSVDDYSYIYEDTSFVYSKKIDDIVYKVSMTKKLSAPLAYMSTVSFYIDMMVVVLKDGFEELPETDWTLAKYIKYPEEANFIVEFTHRNYNKGYWTDESPEKTWAFNMNAADDDLFPGDSIETAKTLIEENGFVLKSETVMTQDEIHRTYKSAYCEESIKNCDTSQTVFVYTKSTDSLELELAVFGFDNADCTNSVFCTVYVKVPELIINLIVKRKTE